MDSLNQRPGVKSPPFDSLGSSVASGKPLSSVPSGFSPHLTTEYLSSLLQRHQPAPLPSPSQHLAAYQTRDLLQSRSGMLGRLRPSEVAGGEALLSVAQQIAAAQLRYRDTATAPSRLPTSPLRSSGGASRGGKNYADLVTEVLLGEVQKSRASSSAWAAHRETELAASEVKIDGRRRPQTVYFERPFTLATSIFSQLAPFTARQAASRGVLGAAVGVVAAGAAGDGAGSGADGGAPATEAHVATALSPAALQESTADADCIVAMPWRPIQHKRLGVPVVLRRPATVAGSGPGSSLMQSRSPLRLPRRKTMLTQWDGDPANAPPSSKGVASGGGGGGEAAVAAAARPYTSQAAAVLASAPSLLEQFTAQSTSDANATVAFAKRFNVGVAEHAHISSSSSSSGVSSLLNPRPLAPLPPVDVINRALRPITAAALSARGVTAAPHHASATLAEAPPALEEGAPLPVPLAPLFVGGLYGQHPLDREAEVADLRDRILKECAKQAKLAGAAAKGGGDKKK